MTIDFQSLEPLAKAQLITSDLSAGGSLTTDQQKTFLKVAIKGGVLLPLVTMKTTSNPTIELPASRFDTVLAPAQEMVPLPEASRKKPTFTKQTITPTLFRGEVPISDEVLEDNIEREALGSLVLTQIAEAAGADMENVSINGDTASATVLLAAFDGWLKLAISNVLAAGTVKLTKSVLRDSFKTLPVQFRKNLPKLKFLTASDATVDYRDSLGDRATPGGDDWLTTSSRPATYAGVDVLPIPYFPTTLGGGNETAMLLTEPENLVIGVRRDIKIEPQRDARSGQTVFVVTVRFGVKPWHEPALAKATGITVG